MGHSISPPKSLLHILLVLEWHASHMVRLCVTFWAAMRLFSTTLCHFLILISNTRVFQFLHIGTHV